MASHERLETGLGTLIEDEWFILMVNAIPSNSRIRQVAKAASDINIERDKLRKNLYHQYEITKALATQLEVANRQLLDVIKNGPQPATGEGAPDRFDDGWNACVEAAAIQGCVFCANTSAKAFERYGHWWHYEKAIEPTLCQADNIRALKRTPPQPAAPQETK